MNASATNAGRRAADWTLGPGKWAASGLLGGAAAVGLIWVLTSRAPAPVFASGAGPITIVRDAPDPDLSDHQSPGLDPAAAVTDSAAPGPTDADSPGGEPRHDLDTRAEALCPVPQAGAWTLTRYVDATSSTTQTPATRPAPKTEPAAPTRVTRVPEPARSDPPVRAQPVAAAIRIRVNTASPDELDLLPGVGPVIAQRIIDERAANGPFQDLRDLERVKGIGPKTAAKMAAHVRFD